ncbi:hypothetical protein B9T23_01855 [Acinetobacter terrae]|uniref:hypothetical protein n=1 Tax=Acinetobacter terrae TaxID=2731247 RepID=UPI000A346088|nr:hypothetical protein [Acinetobacter terrae]OTG78837.1 hypothetical protein B9T23_01855 [Acinetobacter terrae]
MNSLDINVYFKDKYGRLCILASAGGTLPKYLLDENGLDIDEDKLLENNKLNNLIYKLPKKFKIGRNPLLSSILTYQYPDIETTELPLDESNINQDYNFTTTYNHEFSQLTNDKILNESVTTEFSDYFFTFDDLAARGFFVYDKLNINHPEDDTFVLVSYPIYDKDNYEHKENYKEPLSSMTSAPRLNIPIIDRKFNKIYRKSFNSLDLINILNSIQ